MRMRPLGKSGIEASVIGFGAWAIGGWNWGGAEEKESIRAIHAFLDAGGNLIDTAPMYGFGLSEEIVGKAIADRRDKVVLATKCAMRWDLNDQQKQRADQKFSTNEEVFDQPGSRGESSFDVYIYAGADGIREEIERSLKRLNTDVIDLYQTHWQHDDVPVEEKMGTLLDLKKEGKIKSIGVSNASPDVIDEYCRYGQLDVDQEKYSMLDRDMESGNLPKVDEFGIAFLAYSPLAQGLLTGKIDSQRKFPETDIRYYKERFKSDNIQKVNAMLEKMKPIADSNNLNTTQLTMAWTLSQRGCSHVLCGARNEQQAIENAAAGQGGLDPKDVASIATILNGYDGC